MLESGRFRKEIEWRLSEPPYAQRRVHVQFECRDEEIVLRVADQGPGFDFDAFIDAEIAIDRRNGCGISIARDLCFDRLTYCGAGNVVEAVAKSERTDR